jgi:hypothetical protein
VDAQHTFKSNRRAAIASLRVVPRHINQPAALCGSSCPGICRAVSFCGVVQIRFHFVGIARVCSFISIHHVALLCL